jgi:hypothetical protein
MKNLTDEILLAEIKKAVATERAAVTEVLRYLAEVEDRKLHLARGCSSLWAITTLFLGYSEGEAYARIQAMRLIREVPLAKEDLEEGKISLTVAADTKSAFIKENKERKKRDEKPLGAEEKQKIVEEVRGKSKREAEIVFQNHFSGTRNGALEKLVIMASPEMLAKLEEVKNLYAHQNFEDDLSKLFELMLDLSLKEAKKKRTEEPPHSSTNSHRIKSRHIPRSARREVWQRSQNECSYVDPVTGRKCGSKHALEVDDIQEWSRGGKHDPDNLRLYCSAHNKFRNFANTG